MIEAATQSPGPGSPTAVVATTDIEVALARLDQVREVLRGIVAIFYADHDMAHYANGRPVLGRLRMCDGRQYLQYSEYTSSEGLDPTMV